LNFKTVELLSNVAVDFNLRRYIKVTNTRRMAKSHGFYLQAWAYTRPLFDSS